jgi:hypothetical protein
VHGPNPAHGLGLSVRRSVGHCGLTPEGAAQQQLGPAGSAAHHARAGATGCSHRGRRQRGGASGHGSPTACVLRGRGEGTKAMGEVHRARRSEAGLTQIAARRWGSGAAQRGGGRRR